MMQTMQYFQPITAHDLTDRDIYWLAKMDAISYDGATGADLVQEALYGLKQIWRIVGGLEGIAVTAVKRSVLQIEFVAGKGLLKNMRFLHDELLQLATQENCNQIECTTTSLTLQRIYARLGYNPVAVVMRIDHG